MNFQGKDGVIMTYRTGLSRAVYGARTPVAFLVATAGALVLSGCDKGKKSEKPSGQVVARLDGNDITQLEVNAELQGTPIPPAITRRDAEKMVLERIITRRMIAEQAEERKLTKTPQFQMQLRRAEEQLKVQALARDIASKVAKPTRDEAIAFMDQNPLLFAQRRIFAADQIQFLRPDNLNDLGIQKAQTMAEVEQILNANKIEFRRQPANLDSLAANPEFVKEISTLLETKPNELFMFPTQAPGAPAPIILVNHVTEVKTVPFVGDKAIEFAQRMLYNQRMQKALADEVQKQQDSIKTRVTYQEGWEPTAPARAAAKALPSGANSVLPVPGEHQMPATAPAAAGSAAPVANPPAS